MISRDIIEKKKKKKKIIIIKVVQVYIHFLGGSKICIIGEIVHVVNI